MLNGTSPSNDCAVYLHHTSGVHYDVVLNVSGILSDKTTLYVSKFLKVSQCFMTYQPTKKAKLSSVSDNDDSDCKVTDSKEN